MPSAQLVAASVVSAELEYVHCHGKFYWTALHQIVSPLEKMIAFLFLAQIVTHGLTLAYLFHLICWCFSIVPSTEHSSPARRAFQVYAVFPYSRSCPIIHLDWVHVLSASGPLP